MGAHAFGRAIECSCSRPPKFLWPTNRRFENPAFIFHPNGWRQAKTVSESLEEPVNWLWNDVMFNLGAFPQIPKSATSDQTQYMGSSSGPIVTVMMILFEFGPWKMISVDNHAISMNCKSSWSYLSDERKERSHKSEYLLCLSCIFSGTPESGAQSKWSIKCFMLRRNRYFLRSVDNKIMC